MRPALLLVFLLVAPGCSGLQPCRDSTEKDEAKTLFDWKPGTKEEEDSKPKHKDGEAEKKNGEAEKPAEPDVIATDRPDFTEASSTVGRGRVQLEMGYTYSRDRDGGVLNAHSYPEALLRVGMFADWFELRVGQNFSNANNNFGGTGGVFNTSGGEDLYLGVKLGLTEQKKCLPEMALVLQTTVPTGPESLTAGRMLPGMNWLYGWDVVPDKWTFAGSTQGNIAMDDGGHSYFEFAQAFTVGYSFTEKLGSYTEFFAFFPDGATAPDTAPEYYFNGGFTYKITPNFQYDIRGGIGLNRHADDYFVGSGFAIRY